MKALILAAGRSTRLRPLTNILPKHLLPVANKPIIYYILEQIRDAGITDIGLVVSRETETELRTAIGDGSRWGAEITYILQSQPLGLAHAVKTGQDYLANSPFLLFLGDNLIQEGVKGLVSAYKASPTEALIVLKEVDDPRSFGVAELDTSGKVVNVVEKPKDPKSNLALVGSYIFTPVVHQAISQLRPSWRGEYEITDAIQKLLEMGKEVKSHILQGWWMDTGKKEDMLTANRVVMDEYLKHSVKGEVDRESRITGEVEISEGVRITGSLINGPVSIAANCRIITSTIGPYTSVGAETVIENSTLENSIVLNNSHLLHIQRLRDSLIGRNVVISHQPEEVIRLFIGDYDRIEI